MRVAFTVYRGNPRSGGQGVYTRYLTRELVRLGHDVTVLSGPPYPELDPGVELRKLESLDLFGGELPFRPPSPFSFPDSVAFYEIALMLTGAFPDPKAFGVRLRRMTAEIERGFDLVHDNQSLNWAVADLAARGMPSVASIHHPITVDRRLALEAASSLKARIGLRRFFSFLPMQAKVARRMSRVITVSQVSALDIAREMGIPHSRISVIPIGVDSEVFRPLPQVRREPGLICTTASAAVPMKGLRYLLEAVKALPDTRLVIMGPHDDSSNVATLIERLGLAERVQLAGSVSLEEMVVTYARSQVAVIPSLYEGFSLPAVEAMACGVPLVASSGGALAEVVGGLAATVKPGSGGLLAIAIEEVLADYEAALFRAEQARIEVLKRYSWERAALLTEVEYTRALAGSRG